MYDFTGQKCPVCNKTFVSGDEIVVCPECGAPYHRDCYHAQGACVFQDKHGSGFEWTPEKPEQEAAEHSCPRCGTACGPQDRFCRNCGAAIAAPSPSAAQSGGQANQGGFDYSRLYNNTYTPSDADAGEADPFMPKVNLQDTVDGIPMTDWAAYVGPSHQLYLLLFQQMERLQRKATMSFSAMVFGPLYFAYRKAWKPAAIFAALTVLVDLPSLLYILSVTESAVVRGLSADLLYRLSAAASVLHFAVMLFRGLYGFYLYKQSSLETIRKIRANYPDDQKRQYVLKAQGGTSWPAVIALVVGWFLMCLGCALLVGPNLGALSALL